MASISKKRHREDATLIKRILRGDGVPLRRRVLRFLAGSWVVILFGALISAVAFFGRQPHAAAIYKGFEPNYTFPAPKDFEYKSEILRREREKEARMKTVQSYRVDMSAAARELALFRQITEKAASEFDSLKRLYVRTARPEAFKKIFAELKIGEDDPHMRDIVDSLAMAHSQLVQHCDSRERYESLARAAEDVYRKFASDGIYDSATFAALRNQSQFAVVSRKALVLENFREVFSQNLSTELWSNIFPQESFSNLSKISRTVSDLFSVSGLMRANMFPDDDATKRLQDEAAAAVPDVVEKVRAGEPLLVRGVRVNDLMLERWRAFCADSAGSSGETDSVATIVPDGDSAKSSFFFYVISTFSALLIGMLFCSLAIPGIFREKRRWLWFAGTLILLNVAGIRIVLELLEQLRFEDAFSRFENIQGWLAAPAAAAIIATVMVGAPFAVAISVFIGAIVTMMVGGNAEFLLSSMVAALVAAYVARGAMTRSTLVRAGVYAGLVVAATSLPIGVHSGLSFEQIAWNLGASISIGLLSGIVVAGVLSIFEGVFKITTNITLLELTDYNHPLLRKLQVVAPGTFHHCVMVADYATKAASEIGANAALCRCAALYHDIGKTLKPEFFTENQNAGLANPHDSITPSMSALIIKSHVREGAELAVEYHLPAPVRDIIEQHHGTSLTGYFIRKARELAELAGEKPAEVDESNYRYDGPKPQSVEAAIVMLCDVVEAASRSIKRVTPQGVEDLVTKLVMDRFHEGELDECPITIKQAYAVRRSLVASVLTTFHSRVEYPKEGESVLEKIRVSAAKPLVRVQEKLVRGNATEPAGVSEPATKKPSEKVAP